MSSRKKSAKGTFTDDEQAAMRERVQELKAGKGDGESAVRAKIAAARIAALVKKAVS